MSVVVISLNVNSIVYSGRRAQLDDFLSRNHGDVILLQETKLDDAVRLRIDGYSIFRTNVRRGWGGTALLIRNDIPVRNVNCKRAPYIATSAEILIASRQFTSHRDLPTRPPPSRT